MVINFYKTRTEAQALTKSLSPITSKSGELRDECDILNPVIEFEYDNNLINSNYAYIPAFKRYYYISDLKINGKRITISFHVDVLMTYKDQIKLSTAHITRSSTNYDLDIADNMIISRADTSVYTRKIGSGFNTTNKFLVTIGG